MAVEKTKPGRGRPTKFNEQLSQIMINLAAEGKTNQEIADIVGVAESTVRLWAKSIPDFSAAIKEVKDVADSLVEAALFQKATGYEGYPPDTTAAIFWLKNRRPTEWRDRHELEVENPSAESNHDEAMGILHQLQGMLSDKKIGNGGT